jgi:transcriptional regulator with GAF, ATPase, and Fis domain
MSVASEFHSDYYYRIPGPLILPSLRETSEGLIKEAKSIEEKKPKASINLWNILHWREYV